MSETNKFSPLSPMGEGTPKVMRARGLNPCMIGIFYAILSLAPMSLAYGVGVGDLLVQSHLDQPFRAQVSLQDIAGLNIDDIRVKLASLEDFDQASIDFLDFLGNLTFKIIKNTKNDATIQIKSDLPVQDPYLAFIIDISWGAGHILKELSALIDPIELKPMPVVLEPQIEVALAEPILDPISPSQASQLENIKPLKVLEKKPSKPVLKPDLKPVLKPVLKPELKSTLPAKKLADNMPLVHIPKKPLELLSPNVKPENLNQRLVMIEEILDTLTQNNKMLKEKQSEYKAENESLVALLKIKEQEIIRLKTLPPPEKPVNLLSMITSTIVLGFAVISLIFIMRLKKNKIKISEIIT